jgi:hypothetical protein
MAAPNMANVATITGKTVGAALTTTDANVVVNAAASGDVYKINTIIVSNVDGTNDADVDVLWNRSGTGRHFAKGITVPAQATLVVVSKENSIYLEEGDSISGSASLAGDLEIIVSYEIITD